MLAIFIILYFLLTLVWTFPLIAAQGSAEKWTDKEMGKEPDDPKGTPLKLRLLPEDRPFPARFRCKDNSSECVFQLAYYLGDGFDLNKKQRLNILFIPGGPGAIVDPNSRSVALRILERKHNVVYFHPRGMAQSAIDGDKEYDQFLRADYVVEDLENLRQEVLKTRPWDAIYAHSWGTVIAQRYAAKFGKAKDSTSKVSSLVLSGPVDRHRTTTHGARNQMIVDNLKMIYNYYRSQGAANCQCESSSFLRPIVTDFSDPQISTFGNRLGATDNFCFLKTTVADKVLKQLEKMISEIDENYGSADLIVDNFDTLKKDKDFQKGFEKLPIEFFAALRYLQMSGAPVKDGLVFVADSRNRINAALLIAHYLTATNRDRCDVKEALFSGAAADCEYCDRLKVAKREQRAFIGGRESLRGNYVFGVYDGVTRWAPVMMGEKGCFSGKDLETFANQSDGEKKFGRDQVKKIGIVVDEKICPWNPADYRHEVPTLLIKGSRDAVVAGCQAEDFFTHGLKDGRRVLLEFRGLGHDVSVANLFEASEPSSWSKSFAGLLEDFIRMSAKPSQFLSDGKVRAKLEKLKVTDRTRDASVTKCGKIS
jgi:pimeloyl-ACP methyl ester carboxylesterase